MESALNRPRAVLPRAFWWIIGLSTAYRLAFAALLPIVTDEAYALAVGRSFSLSFFDHPPVGFWLPAIAERLTGSDAAAILRLPEILCGTLSLWLLYRIGERLGGERAAVWSMLIGALTPALTYAGVLILPDGPLYLGTLGAVYALVRLAQGENGIALWFWGGVALALALASKYQAGLLPISVLVWMGITPEGRRWFLRPGFYLAVSIALAGLAPMVLWNLDHDWASFRFHSGRAGGGFSATNGLRMIAGQALYLSPLVFFWAFHVPFGKWNWTHPDRRLLLLIAAGPVVMFNAIYWASSGTLPHWSMPGWIVALPLVGSWLAATDAGRATRIWLAATAGVIHAVLVVLAFHMSTGMLTARFATLPAWDRTAPNADLADMAAAIRSSGVLDGAGFVLAQNWIQGGHLSAALGPDIPVRIASDAPHHFAFMAGADAAGAGVLLAIVDAQVADQAAAALLEFGRALDPGATPRGLYAIPRGGRDYFVIAAVGLAL